LDVAANRSVRPFRGKVEYRDMPFFASLGDCMSRIFCCVFCFVVAFLVVYNGLQLPSIAGNSTARTALKVGAVVFTVLGARLIFKPAKSSYLFRRLP
jgi:hypothetical protein